jgi:hypothetical protein
MTLFCLLFQQLAMAAYVCTLPSAATHPVASMEDCAAMGMGASDQAATHHLPADPRCAEHCASHVPATPEVRSPAVPPLLLPSDVAIVTQVGIHSPTRSLLPDPELYPPEPPPALRFCSLLI